MGNLVIEKNEFFRVENDYGKLDVFYEPKSILERYANLQYEREYFDILTKGNYDYFVDVGAAWGYFTRIAAKHCKGVIAIEAQPIRYGFLEWNTKELKNVHCFYNYLAEYGIGTKPKIATNPIRMVGKPGASYQDEAIDYNIYVETIDDLIFSQLIDLNLFPKGYDGELKDFEKVLIKMDIEGGELSALRGAKKVLDQDKVIDWLIDFHPYAGVKFDDLVVFFKDRNVKRLNGNKIYVT